MATVADETAGASRIGCRPPAKQARSRRTRQRLIDAGLALLEERDFDQTGIAEFAAAAGASVGAFYHHFADKEDFYGAVIAAGIEGEWTRVDAAFADGEVAGLSAAALMERAVRVIRDIMQAKQGLIRTVLKRSIAKGRPAATEADGQWAPLRDFARAYEARVGDLLAARAGEIGCADWQRRHAEAMQMVLSTLFNAVINRPRTMALEGETMVVALTDMACRYLEVHSAAGQDGDPALDMDGG